MRLVLASTSPRRRQILALLGVPFEVIAPEFEERISAQLPADQEVLEFALGKAQSVATKHPGSIVIGSDTMIELSGEKIGKPADREDARRILRALSGKTHRIFTSVALVDSGERGIMNVETVSVEMRRYTEEEIENYLRSGESDDKAGAYSIQGQGSDLIKSICGDYLAAVGMPLRRIALYLKSRGLAVADIEKVYAEKSFMNWRRFA
ncbi:MAG TPA: Maf family protein [Candidatus Eisenbacteria bacterium]|nr:Maf family protein [Candidatus Eisenbacteria bacterium]